MMIMIVNEATQLRIALATNASKLKQTTVDYSSDGNFLEGSNFKANLQEVQAALCTEAVH